MGSHAPHEGEVAHQHQVGGGRDPTGEGNNIVPGLHKLLIDYLDEDFEDFAKVSEKLSQTLINVLWLPGIRSGLNNGINNAAQENCVTHEVVPPKKLVFTVNF